MSDVEGYVTKHELTDILPLVLKGALVAQNPGGFETIPELDESDRTHLRN